MGETLGSYELCLGVAGEAHTISPSDFVVCRDPTALCPPPPHRQQSSAPRADTTFLQVYHVLTAPKHPQISSPARKMFLSKEEAVTVLVLGFAELWVAGSGCSPPRQCFALLVKGSWHSALPSVEIWKPDYIPQHMFGDGKQLSEVGGIALIANLKSRAGKPGCRSELPLGRATGSEEQLWALPHSGGKAEQKPEQTSLS